MLEHIHASVLAVLAVLTIAASAHGDAGKPVDTKAWLYDASLKFVPAFEITFQTGDKKTITESVEEHRARRAKATDATLRAASDVTMPSLFPGPHGREMTALFVVSVWAVESHFDLRIERDHCASLPKGSCDSGAAYCYGQIHPADVPELAARGWKGLDLEQDPEKCARATIWRLASALRTCEAQNPKLEGGDKFAPYATGRCAPNENMRGKFNAAKTWMQTHPLP